MQIRSALVPLCTLGVPAMGALAQTSAPPTSGPPDAEQRLSSVLTASQLKKFQVLMEDEHGPGRGPRGRWHGDSPPSG